MTRNALILALSLVGLFASGCENGPSEKEKAPAEAPLVVNAPLPVVSAALPKPIDLGPLPVPADPAVLVPAGAQSAAATKAAAGDPPKTSPTEPPSVRGTAPSKTPGPMAPRTPATM